MKDEPIPINNHAPFPESSFTPHPWVGQDTTLTPIADAAEFNGIAGGLPAGNNPLGRSAMVVEPNTLINWKESE
jgi:hypothetical protein